jgi:hypothetical protein
MSEYENDGFDQASEFSAAKNASRLADKKKKSKPPVTQSINSSASGANEDDLKIDSASMFKIDFSHLENIMQGFSAKIDTVGKKMKKMEANSVAQQQASNRQVNNVVKKLEQGIEGAN